jgi:hypothetical protein
MDPLGFFLMVVWPFAAPLLVEVVKARRRGRRVSGQPGEREHGVNCGQDGVGLCVRCAGFQPGHRWRFRVGNESAVKHGTDSEARLRPIADAYLVRLQTAAPTGDQPPDEFALERLAFLLARIHLAEAYVDEHGLLDGQGKPRPVVASLSTWDNSVRKLLAELGLTAVSRATLRLDLLRGDLIDVAVAQAGFLATMSTAVDVAVEVAEAMLPEELREPFVREFRARYLPAASEAVSLVEAKHELPAGELVAEEDEP